MNKQQITLYCKKEGWAVAFANKQELLKTYNWSTINKNVGSHYKELKVRYFYAWDWGSEKRVLMDVKRETYYSNYIMRDWNGQPVTAQDLPRPSLKRKKKAPVIHAGYPVEGTGKKKKTKYRNDRNLKYKRTLKKVLDNENKDESGNAIPPVRAKVKNKALKLIWDDFDRPYSVLINKSWKKYRKHQWK